MIEPNGDLSWSQLVKLQVCLTFLLPPGIKGLWGNQLRSCSWSLLLNSPLSCNPVLYEFLISALNLCLLTLTSFPWALLLLNSICEQTNRPTLKISWENISAISIFCWRHFFQGTLDTTIPAGILMKNIGEFIDPLQKNINVFSKLWSIWSFRKNGKTIEIRINNWKNSLKYKHRKLLNSGGS